MEQSHNDQIRGQAAHALFAGYEGQSELKEKQDSDSEKQPVQHEEQGEPPYSIMGHRKKVTYLLLVSFMAMISPLSSSVYYPALNEISEELGVTSSQTNVSIVTYMVSGRRSSANNSILSCPNRA